MNSRANFRVALRAPAGHGGFSLIELIMAAAMAACVITTAVMIYQSLTASGGTRSVYGTVDVGAALPQFYGGTATTIDAYFAPNYGRVAQAEAVRDQFLADLQKASAVFCLGRNVVNTVHPTTIAVSGTFRGGSLDTPDAFRDLIDHSAATFVPYSGASTATNASIFILQPSQAPAPATATTPEILPTLAVLAVYDIDLTAANSPAGTYVSVKRYATGVLTEPYYDVFYPSSTGAYPFNPLVVFFGRAAGNSTDPLRQAAERPFYFVWWPDPTTPTLEAFSAAATNGATDPRTAYASMGGRTSFFFVVPMFPSL